MNELDSIWLRKYALAQLSRFKRRCYICHLLITRPRRFTFHHLYYDDEDHPLVHYRTKHEYTDAILDQVEKKPEKFRLLCGGHHYTVGRLAQYGTKTLRRLLMVVRETRGKK